MEIEKTPLKSKKFIAFFFTILVVAGILIAALLTQTFNLAMASFMSIGIAGICALGIGYVLSQKALDKYMRGISGKFEPEEPRDPETERTVD